MRFWRAIKVTVLLLDIVLVVALYRQAKDVDDIIEHGIGVHATVSAKNGLKLRATASLDGKVVGYLGNGTRVVVLDSLGPNETVNGRTFRWLKVSAKNRQGWVWGGYVDGE